MKEMKNTSMKREHTEKAVEIIGKNVIDSRGKEIGKIKNIHIDPDELTVEGITISNGLFKEKDYVGRGYITSLTSEGAVLSSIPITQFFGMKVIDSSGKEVGKVKEIYRARKTDSVYSITVDRGISKNDLVISDNFIKNIGENIILEGEVEA